MSKLGAQEKQKHTAIKLVIQPAHLKKAQESTHPSLSNQERSRLKNMFDAFACGGQVEHVGIRSSMN